MNASSWSLRNLPWFRATLAQWRYALRNTIAMCLALTVAYYLNLDEPYWAMTSAAVVSFPTVGAISKSLGRIAGSLLGAIAALLLAGHTLNEPWFFRSSMSAWLGFCTWACAHFTNNVAYAFQLAGYTAAIIAFPMVNITGYQWRDCSGLRVCEVIVGILCGGMMMMILPSSSDATALLTALKNMHARLLEHASLLWQPETTDAIRAAHEGVIGQILTMNLLRIQAFWSHYRFRQQNARLNALLHQQFTYDQCHLQPATYVAQLALTARCHTRNSRTVADGARQFANRCLHRRTYYRPATPDQRRRLSARRLLAATTLFLPPLSAK
ncbi:FUSC family protein [Escherichia coli]